ncbi:MAG: hypothetical protein ACOCQG_05025 [Candidatus Nanoarchaeia archaeon]
MNKTIIPIITFVALIIAAIIVSLIFLNLDQEESPVNETGNSSLNKTKNESKSINKTVNNTTLQEMECYDLDYQEEKCREKEGCTLKEDGLCISQQENKTQNDKSPENINCYEYDFNEEECKKYDECHWNEQDNLCTEEGQTSEEAPTNDTNATTKPADTTENVNCYDYDFDEEGCLSQDNCEWDEANSLCMEN